MPLLDIDEVTLSRCPTPSNAAGRPATGADRRAAGRAAPPPAGARLVEASAPAATRVLAAPPALAAASRRRPTPRRHHADLDVDRRTPAASTSSQESGDPDFDGRRDALPRPATSSTSATAGRLARLPAGARRGRHALSDWSNGCSCATGAERWLLDDRRGATTRTALLDVQRAAAADVRRARRPARRAGAARALPRAPTRSPTPRRSKRRRWRARLGARRCASRSSATARSITRGCYASRRRAAPPPAPHAA